MTNIGEVMEEINRYFEITLENNSYAFASSTKKITGTFDETYLVGQYIRVYGSILNDDVYKISAVGTDEITVEETLIDEDVEGSSIYVAALAPPKPFLSFVAEIVASVAAGDIADGVVSETIDNYNVVFKGDGAWVSVYAKRLSIWRKVRWASNVYSQIL